MAITKIQSESMNLADTYAFTGTVTGAGKEITEMDMWRLNTSFAVSGNSSYSLINSGWERADTDGFQKKGTGLTESSGVFTFPSTGYWKIDWSIEGIQNNDNYFRIRLFFGGTSGNDSYISSDVSGANASQYCGCSGSAIIYLNDVTDKFSFYNSASHGTISGDTGANRSGFTCIKLNDI